MALGSVVFCCAPGFRILFLSTQLKIISVVLKTASRPFSICSRRNPFVFSRRTVAAVACHAVQRRPAGSVPGDGASADRQEPARPGTVATGLNTFSLVRWAAAFEACQEGDGGMCHGCALRPWECGVVLTARARAGQRIDARGEGHAVSHSLRGTRNPHAYHSPPPQLRFLRLLALQLRRSDRRLGGAWEGRSTRLWIPCPPASRSPPQK